MQSKKETIIISLGGSLVVPENFDLSFLKKFKHTLQKYSKTHRFFVFVGGGKPVRNYQKALLEFGAKNNQRDWAGIDISRLNAKVVAQLFGGLAYPNIVTDPTKKIKTSRDVVIGAGYKPGWSTDYVSVLAAKTYEVKTIINLSNIDYVYDKNPSQFPDAKPIKEIDWKSFVRIVGEKWTPGLSMPFDPKASKLASQLKLKVVVINGKYLDRLEGVLSNKPFIGTIIQ